jgi:hypothetical protein
MKKIIIGVESFKNEKQRVRSAKVFSKLWLKGYSLMINDYLKDSRSCSDKTGGGK